MPPAPGSWLPPRSLACAYIPRPHVSMHRDRRGKTLGMALCTLASGPTQRPKRSVPSWMVPQPRRGQPASPYPEPPFSQPCASRPSSSVHSQSLPVRSTTARPSRAATRPRATKSRARKLADLRHWFEWRVKCSHDGARVCRRAPPGVRALSAADPCLTAAQATRAPGLFVAGVHGAMLCPQESSLQRRRSVPLLQRRRR